LLSKYRTDINNIVSSHFLDKLLNFDEKILIKKKEEYKKRGIILRSDKKTTRVLLTTSGLIPIIRTILRAKDTITAVKLLEDSQKNSIIPLDEYLRIDILPFKVTARMMIEIAFWAQNQGSYERAEKILKKLNFNIHDDTIRDINNFVGSIIHSNDVIRAAKNFNNMKNTKFIVNKKCVIYIKAYCAAINTRHCNKIDSTWRENKLGIVFNSDKICYTRN
jgi:TATA-box binding protein (TBP) (component of TFIID and TFIIIB)